MALFKAAFILLSMLVGSLAKSIHPGATWTVENTGTHMQAHGTGIIYVDGYYYAVGENKTYTEDNTSGSRFNSVACYRSPDLTTWEFVNNLLTATTTVDDLTPTSVIERPKIIYNELTEKYVMWMHVDNSDYSAAKAGVATCDTVCGDYDYLGSARPFSHISRDMGLFVDDDANSTAYLMSEDRANGARLYQLSANYTAVVNETYTYEEDLEAPAMVKKDGVYFFFGSTLSGWSANANRYSTATSIYGPWADFGYFAPSAKKTYNSQTTFVLPLGPTTIGSSSVFSSNATSFLYLGDRWHSSALWSSRYIWLPLTLDADARTASMSYWDHFEVDFSSGDITVPTLDTYLAEDATSTGDASTVANSAASSGYVVGPIGGSSDGTITWESVSFPSDGDYTIAFNYTNTASNTSFASLSINGGTSHKIAFLTTDSGVIGTSVWQYSTVAGSATVELSGYSSEDEADVAYIDNLSVSQS
ncbi:MAG: hypothetical protein M1834_002853 [Cirrosporium novae-zelandiae]|nr:MAG: hypothetical protein M1834_002853 [Cirrosporium novae-zelandiae]